MLRHDCRIFEYMLTYQICMLGWAINIVRGSRVPGSATVAVSHRQLPTAVLMRETPT